MEPDDVTLGEVGRRVDRLDREMGQRFDAIGKKIDNLSFVPSAVYASDKAGVEQRLGKLDAAATTAEGRAWQVRIALVVAIFGLPVSIAGGIITAIVVKSIN